MNLLCPSAVLVQEQLLWGSFMGDLWGLASDIFAFLGCGPQALLLLACFLHVPLGQRRDDFFKEFFGTIIMVMTQFTPGKWVGQESWWYAWLCHAGGVIIADWIAGGPNVNPSVAFNLMALGMLPYPAFLCRVSAQFAGGLVAFSLCRWIATVLNLPALGGPSFDSTETPLVRLVIR
jgi:hypothetical protein